MLPKNINKHLNDMKFYIFEQSSYDKVQKKIEQCIKELNKIQTEDKQIKRYRYGLDICGWSYTDYIVEFYFDKWEFAKTSFGGSAYNAPIKLSTRGFLMVDNEQTKIIRKYFGDYELDFYKMIFNNIFNIRNCCGKDYNYTRNRVYKNGKWHTDF